MTARVVLVLAFVSCAAAMPGGQGGQTPPSSNQTFRTSTDVVMVDVSVKRGNSPVKGLTAADFELRDNGVKQEIETVEAKAVPIDLSIVVDVSGDPLRPWVKPTPVAKISAEVETRVRRLTALLREGDRVRLFAVDTSLQPVWPLQAAAAVPPVRPLQFDGQASLYNTLMTVLMQPVEPTRRHVIVAATKGRDTVSSISAAGLRAIAERSDAQMHLVMEEKAADIEYQIHVNQCSGGPGVFVPGQPPTIGPPVDLSMGLCRPTRRFWTGAPRRLFALCGVEPGCLHELTRDGLELKAGAEATGGGLYQGEAFSEPSLFSVFSDAFENFRQSYVLRYSARGVTRAGWHQITVTVPKDKSLTIQSRTGYAVDAPPPAKSPAPAPAPNPSALRTLPDLIATYGRGAYDTVTVNLRQISDPVKLITDFDRGGNPWPELPRREAAFALELAEAGFYSPQQPARDAAADLLRRFAFLVRDPLGPDAFERNWLLGAVTMVQGTIRPAASQPIVDIALARFPDEPRFKLAKAIVTDQRWPFTGIVGADNQQTRVTAGVDHTNAVIALYEAAAAYPETRAEALLRLGWFLHRVRRGDDGLARMQRVEVSEAADRGLLYLRELLTGQILIEQNKPEPAIAAFRRAIAIVPAVQSARVALMNALLVSGDRAGADALAGELQTTTPAAIDPWWMYWQADYRRYPLMLNQLREMIR